MQVSSTSRYCVAEFRPQLLQGRKLRNTPGGYSILEAREVATEFAEYLDLGTPRKHFCCVPMATTVRSTTTPCIPKSH